MSFITDDFLLKTETAKRLFHEVAKELPIYDYHCHLPPEDIANNRRFPTLFDIWLEEDHYKWRAMRANGVEEAYCTGDADPYEKYLAFVKTVPHTLRNPMYHWSHLELKRYFDIDTLISEDSAKAIWDEANEKLKSDELSAHGILKNFDVKVICTTDDPVDSLEHHKAIAEDPSVGTSVCPTFRPDKALRVDDLALFNEWCDKLAEVTDIEISSFAQLKEAIKQRHDYFHAMGGRLSDHGLKHCFDDFCTDRVASSIFERARNGQELSSQEVSQYASNLMVFLGELDAEKGWTKQLHIGVIRNNNTRLFNKIGPDAGFDSIGDYPQGLALGNYLNELDKNNTLPRTIIYNLNPVDNYLIATTIGNFQDGTIAGKIQLGSGWWFNDQKEGMQWQMNALSNLGLFSRFVGMLTDSRSLLSYPRHEYFRRILCNLVGDDVENGEIPKDWDLYSNMVRDICYNNALNYFGIEVK